jgi:AcrR family transcriptional regulator
VTNSPADRAALSVDRIVDAALEMIDVGGVDAFSMRKLAADLGVNPMSLYWHVENKEELLDLVAARVLGDQATPCDGSGDWRANVADILRALRRDCLDHPNVLALLRQPRRWVPGLAPTIDALLRTMADAGYSTDQAAAAQRLLVEHTLSSMMIRAEAEAAAGWQEIADATLAVVPEGSLVHLRSMHATVENPSDDERFEWELRCLLRGIEGEFAEESS